MSESSHTYRGKCIACGQRPRLPGHSTCSAKCAAKLKAFTKAKFANSFSDRGSALMPSEQSDSGAMAPGPERAARWRDRKYGQYRSEGTNIRAYIVGRRAGRRFLRILWQAKRSYRS